MGRSRQTETHGALVLAFVILGMFVLGLGPIAYLFWFRPLPMPESPVPSEMPSSAHSQQTTQMPGQTLRNSFGMTFVAIPAGSFMMGSPREEPGRDADEAPYLAAIANPFYLQTTEVTQSQWQTVMNSDIIAQRNRVGPTQPLQGLGRDYPMYYVSWEDVQRFIQALNQRGEGRYRLPSEAEWEYAARAGSETTFSFGADAVQLKEYAWYKNNALNNSHPVGEKKPNAWGLFDMYGNVWEWVQDGYGPYPVKTTINPTGASSSATRVIRGGAWPVKAYHCRSANRIHYAPHRRFPYVGFRLVWEPA